MIPNSSRKQVLLMLSLLAVLTSPARADVRIVQVLYDPAGSESGGEFVQLLNEGNTSVDIGGWVLATGSSMSDIIFPRGTVIPQSRSFLVADKGWNSSRDNASWPLADLEDVMTLVNVNSGVAVLRNGTVVDAVGWGNVSNPLLFKGSPASSTKEGQALRRVSFTGSNGGDFVPSAPSFDQVRPQGGVELTLDVDSPPEVSQLRLAVSVEDDDPSPGFQLAPFPGVIREIQINISQSSKVADEFIVEVFSRNVTVPLNASSAVFSSPSVSQVVVFTPLSYDTPPGLYALTVSARQAGERVGNASVFINVLPVMSISMDSPSVSLGRAAPGSTIVVRGDEDPLTRDRPTVWNSGNVNAGLTLLGSDLTGAGVNGERSSVISSSAVQVTLVQSRKPVDSMRLSTSAQEVGVRLGVRGIAGLDISLLVPPVPSGRYAGRLWLLASGENGGG